LDSFGVHRKIYKFIHRVKIRLDEPRDRKALGAGTNSAVGSFLYQRPATERLASRAEAGAAVLHRDPLDGAAANGAGFASNMHLDVR